MKQGIHMLLPVEIDFDLNEVKRIEFIIRQKNTELVFEYPSARAQRRSDEENIVDLEFTEDETWLFSPTVPAELDTRLHLIDSPYNPETVPVRFDVHRTLFKEVSSNE